MSDLNSILNEDKEWRKRFDSIKVTGKCDSGCGKDAVRWFGNTSVAVCKDTDCFQKQAEAYANFTIDSSYDDEEF